MALNEGFVLASGRLGSETESQINEFYTKINTQEKNLGQKIIINEDKKSKVHFIECHISTEFLSKNMDLDAEIDPDDQENYRANRDLQTTNSDYLKMVDDAKNGRQFSDIVIEYNSTYRHTKPLKILGGQHRSSAISSASPTDKFHGVRIYFNLDIAKRVDLYRISNTNIQVSQDLLDRLTEQSLSPPGTLRDFAQDIGLLRKNEDFGEKRSSDDPFSPTVRMLRTFIVNFHKGKSLSTKPAFDSLALIPHLPSSSTTLDPEYKKIFEKEPNFKNQSDLLEAGKNFVKLHKKQFESITQMDVAGKREFRIKSLHLAVLSAWAFAAGLLQSDPTRLQKFYSLPDQIKKDEDPLNAKAMSQARYQDVDPSNYRGLGTRTGPSERGRVLQLFLGYSKTNKPKITREMCNAAIQIFEANRALKGAKKSEESAFG